MQYIYCLLTFFLFLGLPVILLVLFFIVVFVFILAATLQVSVRESERVECREQRTSGKNEECTCE